MEPLNERNNMNEFVNNDKGVHRCGAQPAEAWVIQAVEDGRWRLYVNGFSVALTHCPWCGQNLPPPAKQEPYPNVIPTGVELLEREIRSLKCELAQARKEADLLRARVERDEKHKPQWIRDCERAERETTELLKPLDESYRATAPVWFHGPERPGGQCGYTVKTPGEAWQCTGVAGHPLPHVMPAGCPPAKGSISVDRIIAANGGRLP